MHPSICYQIYKLEHGLSPSEQRAAKRRALTSTGTSLPWKTKIGPAGIETRSRRRTVG
jgi:hypothetical protein